MLRCLQIDSSYSVDPAPIAEGVRQLLRIIAGSLPTAVRDDAKRLPRPFCYLCIIYFRAAWRLLGVFSDMSFDSFPPCKYDCAGSCAARALPPIAPRFFALGHQQLAIGIRAQVDANDPPTILRHRGIKPGSGSSAAPFQLLAAQCDKSQGGSGEDPPPPYLPAQPSLYSLLERGQHANRFREVVQIFTSPGRKAGD
jgi:hypothetical protein